MDAEPHVLTDSEKSKTVPCISCGQPCVVHVYAANALVKCLAHRGAQRQRERGRSSVLSPFEAGLPLEDRNSRSVGAIVRLKRVDGGVSWDEDLTLTGVVGFDEETGAAHVYAVVGTSLPKFDPRRECGQHRHFLLSEVAEVR